MDEEIRILGWTYYKKEEQKPYILHDLREKLPLQYFRTKEEAEKLAKWRCGEDWEKQFEIEEKIRNRG